MLFSTIFSINLKANMNGGDIRKKTILYDELFPAA
jgi:hypothetical protein